MLCPFCLAEVKLNAEKVAGRMTPVYLCPECNEQVPALYTQGYRNYPPVVVSAIGFRQHGKTVYFSSLFYALKKLPLADYWPTFYTMALNEDSLDTVYGNVRMLEGGELPYSTPKNFPRPTMLRLEDVPLFRHVDYTLLCYDTGGECFERPTQLVQFAGFVRRARTAMLLFSLTDMEDPAGEMFRLLNTYLVGMGELGARIEEQSLVVVYTKADRMAVRFPSWSTAWHDLEEYLLAGSVESLAQPRGYIRQMERVSGRLNDFTREELQAGEFLNAARRNFRGVAFTIVSALGAEPSDGRMPVHVAPRRILDPLLWMIKWQG